jgi:hypothetical protein
MSEETKGKSLKQLEQEWEETCRRDLKFFLQELLDLDLDPATRRDVHIPGLINRQRLLKEWIDKMHWNAGEVAAIRYRVIRDLDGLIKVQYRCPVEEAWSTLIERVTVTNVRIERRFDTLAAAKEWIDGDIEARRSRLRAAVLFEKEG